MTSTTQATAAEAKERAADVKNTATEQAAQVSGTVKEQTGQVVQEASAQARNLMEEARGQVREQFGQQQSRIRQFLDEFADELDTMATAGGRDGIATEVVRQVAARTRGVSTSFGTTGPEDALASVRSFARRRPGTFLLAAGLAGVLAGRATRGAKELKSGSQEQPRRLGQVGYPQAGYRQGEYGRGGLGEPIVTESYVSPTPVEIDLTSADAIEADVERERVVRPGAENEWAPVAGRSRTDGYPEEGQR